MSKIVDNYRQLLSEIQHLKRVETKLIVVSKKQSINAVEELYNLGVRDFGENRVAEALLKKDKLPKDINWHLIGPLQKNKVRKAVGNFVLIHSVDSYDLAEKISEVSKEMNCVTSILLQVNASGEMSKQGLSLKECFLQFDKFKALENIDIRGFMTMAPFTEDVNLIHQTFKKLKQLLQEINEHYYLENSLNELSMGMTHDYKIAIEEGSTILRIGSYLFN